MQSGKSRLVCVGVGLLLALSPRGEADAQNIQAWAEMPESLPAYEPPNKPVTRLSEILAKHQGHQSWTEPVFRDHIWNGDYISMAPGERTPRRFHQDHRIFWFVQDGQIRFEIEGKEPFVASKGYMVQVPKRLVYSMQTVGNQPSLRFEVTMANAGTLYPLDEALPPPREGVVYELVEVANAKGAYDEANLPYIDFNRIVAGNAPPKRNPTQFVGPPHVNPESGYTNIGIANIIRGTAPNTPMPGPGSGHTHLGGPEAWFVMEGQQEVRFGHLPTMIASQGDVLYVPSGWYHNLRHYGPGTSTRVALVAYSQSHVFPSTGGSESAARGQ
jgi:quercetin dioxygenase-like cupin family protein